MSTLTARKVRFSADYRAPFGSATLKDEYTGQVIETVRGNATRFEVTFYEGPVLADLSEVQTLNLKIQPSQTEDGPLADKTLALADLDLTTDAESWSDGTKQHAAFLLSNADMNIAMAGEMQSLWLVVTAITTDGFEVTLAAGTILLHEDNNGSLAEPPENPGTYLTLEQGDARYGAPGTTAPITGANVTYAGVGVPEFEEWGGFYAQDLLLEGKNSYLSESGTNVVRWRSGGGGKWTYEGSGQVEVFYSTSQVAEPWLATDWKISGSAVAEPNFSVTNGSTQAPPFLRVAGGFLYVQESGVWKKATLSGL